MGVPTLATFDVNKSSDRQRFLQFIKTDLRRRLQDPDHSFVFGSASVGRLLPQQINPADAALVDLVVRAGESGITLRLRTDNLYVVGFRNGSGTWFEFTHDHPGAMIDVGDTNDRREDLAFSGSYTGEGLGSLDTIVGRENILGMNAVQQAVINLAEYTGGNQTDSDVKRWLRSLIVNFIESTRFDTLAERVHDLMTNPPRDGDEREKLQKLTAELAALLRRWGSLSDAVVLAANYPTAQDFTSFQGVGVHNAYTAATTLGIVLISISSSSRSLLVHDDQGSNDRQLQLLGAADADAVGLTLVEVMGVVINDIDRENPGDLYGTIRITDGFGTETLFDRGDHDSQSVGPGGWADHTWPTRALSGADDFVIDVHLMDYDGIGPNDHVADGQVAWNSRDTVGGDYDTLRRKRVDGQYGSVEVQYAVLTQAVVAAVRVVMVDGDGEAKPDVYGTVTARTRMSSGELLEYKLFNRSQANDIGVDKGADVPLTRKVISAALGSRLEIDANLWDRDRDPSPDDQIALGSATFEPQLKGSAGQEISGQYGKVKVQVTWSTSFEHV